MNTVHAIVNCGFARAAMREISEVGKGRYVTNEDKQLRIDKFRTLFSSTPSFINDNSVFSGYDHRDAPFTRYSKCINAMIRKWTNREQKASYFKQYNTENWKKLQVCQKKKHTMTNCKECATNNSTAQGHFPGPTFTTPTTEITDTIQTLIGDNESARNPAAATTRQILAEIEPQFHQSYGVSFTSCIVKEPGSNLQIKTTPAEKKKRKRKIQRDCRDTMIEQFKQSDPLQVLAEGQSLQSYKRMRLSQSFQSPQIEATTLSPPKPRKHSPNFSDVEWDKEGLLQKLRNWPIGDVINWSQTANEFHIKGGNKGQIVKEFAKENGIDVTQLDKRPMMTRARARKLRMPGVGISVPTHPTVQAISEEWSNMISRGELTLGEPCHPQTISRLSVKTGELKKTEHTVYGRKIPLIDIRRRLLAKQEHLMHLQTDDEIDKLSDEEIRTFLLHKKIPIPDDTQQSLKDLIKSSERTRTLGIWHDHSSILGRGYVLVTVKVFYDPAVFETETDSNTAAIQARIEEPEIHILAMSTSSVEHQAALISDRLHCMKEISEPLQTKNDITITDKLMFFTGDKPAAQFERGTQVGGHYPCGSCGTHVSRFNDFAHCCTARPRTIQDLQKLVIQGGECGKKPGHIKPFEALKTQEIRKELQTRQWNSTGTTKKALTKDLKDHLKGVQRVPSLLLTNPTEPLENLNLQHYQILECEPLHDLKGHLSNVLHELPTIMEEPLSAEVQAIIDCDLNSKETKRGGDYRLAVIHILALLQSRATPPPMVLKLIETIVEMSEIMYSDESKRSPQLILRLYNTSWLHFELCKELLFSPQTISHKKMFGTYLHSLCIHAPVQYQIVNLKATNTEHEERLFGQAKDIASRATNRQPNTIVPNILLRLQAKQQKKALYTSYHQMCSKISKAANELQGQTENTKISHEFLTSRASSWQLHLQRISLFLKQGPGVWWHLTADGYEFHDGSSHPNCGEEGPVLTHFRNTSIDDIYLTSERAWRDICDNKIELPTTSICMYDDNGDYVKRLTITHADYTPTEHNTEALIRSDSDGEEPETEDALSTDCTEVCLQKEMHSEAEEATPTTPTYRTKFATAVFRALGESALLSELDLLRQSVRESPHKVSQTIQATYKKLMQAIERRIKTKVIETKEAIKNFEHSFYTAKHYLPSEDIPEYKSLNKKMHYLKKLISSLNFRM